MAYKRAAEAGCRLLASFGPFKRGSAKFAVVFTGYPLLGRSVYEGLMTAGVSVRPSCHCATLELLISAKDAGVGLQMIAWAVFHRITRSVQREWFCTYWNCNLVFSGRMKSTYTRSGSEVR